jgi:hypothetical protein
MIDEIKKLEKSTNELEIEVRKMIQNSKIDTVVIIVLMSIIGFLIGWCIILL